MNKPMGEFTKKILGEWAVQLGREVGELVKMYDGAYEVLEKMGKPADQLEEMAKTRVRSQLRNEFSSPAVSFRGRVLAKSDPFNMNAGYWNSAKVMYGSAERQQWIDKKIINDKGEPLDTREVFKKSKKKNPNFGNVLKKENFLTNVFGVFLTTKGEPMPAKVTLSDKKARIAVPVDVPVQVRLNDRSEKGATFRTLSSGTPTEFKPIQDPDIPDAETLISMYCDQFFTTLKQIEEVHTATVNPDTEKADPTRMTIIECELITLDNEANPKTHNYRMVVGDESLGFTDKEKRGTVVWVAEGLYPTIKDAGRGSRMFVIGQTTQPQTSTDFATGEKVNKPGDVGMNAMGIFVKKGWLLPKDEEPYEEQAEAT
jgi:hypothetical protein